MRAAFLFRMLATLAILATGASACTPRAPAGPGAVTPQSPQPPHAIGAPSPPRAAGMGGDRPRLIVSVVFDQLGSETLSRLLPHLSAEGAIRRGIAQGHHAERARYTHAITLTAPNHTAIYSGATPDRSGITGNLLRMPDGEARASIDDAQHQVLGSKPGTHAGPAALHVPTVADVLKQRTDGRGKVVSLSLKDRGAILPAGKHPDLVLWFDTTVPGFTTSTYYASTPPAWLSRFSDAYPLDLLLRPWLPEDPDLLARVSGADAAPGEGRYLGWSTTFPHDPREASDPHKALRLTPALSLYLLELAAAAVDAHDLGADDVPDLLALSISGPDYVGHVFGPDSWEYLDHLRRADAALGELLSELAGRIPMAALITSDHGVCRLPEQLPDVGPEARIPGQALASAAEQAIRKVHGAPADGAKSWVEGFAAPYLYLSSAARAHRDRVAITATAVEALRGTPTVHAAFDARRLASEAKTALERDVAAAIHAEASGDVYVVPARHSMTDIDMVPGAGTTHGSPWTYDRDVPVIVSGTGVPPGRIAEPVRQTRVASTLAKLLGVPAPAPDAPPPLF